MTLARAWGAGIHAPYGSRQGELRSPPRWVHGQPPLAAGRPRDTFRMASERGPDEALHHIAICAGLVAIAIVLVTVGATAVAFVPALGCALMRGLMIWMMVRPHGHGGGGGA